MADPFEVRMRFTNQLRQLNASVTSAQKAAQYALKNRDMAEDLHSCILEQLERNNMNTRANILYFLEPFLTLCAASSCPDYIRMMQRDIIRVVDAVAPDDGSGAANVKVARQVLRALAAKAFLELTTLAQIEEVLRDREGGAGGDDDLDRKQVEQRIEEDRERHKRQRENHWAVPAGGYAELERLWEETSDLGEDDGRMLEEEWQEWKGQMKAAGAGCEHGRANGKH
ncbi:CTD kinase subunit gamma CTK3-domain-containing protein [Schizothecium vesticola]|uniref:CTD kinase subunit gamma CTK3-domain-containing protein n=1 Tax=Schizothecium vesticola TaxID=314040 RepID=A0AA40BQI0_9PEZI|nr:CTD kinase subunit gamma CTK3-domain-containing protein [Schizothecium vesticola]